MKIINRKILYSLIGISAGLMGWPIAEVLLYFQGDFSSYLLFSISLGAVFGVVVGFVFGSAEGVIISNRYRVLTGGSKGLIIGFVGGALGFLSGQAVLLYVGEFFVHQEKLFAYVGLPFSRAVGWVIMGLFVGSVDAFRNYSHRRLRIGVLGGVLGGLAGGLVFEYCQIIMPVVIGRLIGLVVFGALLGLSYGVVESRLALGVFYRSKWKEQG